jgi:uncharacterized protein (TIGR03067 family)
MERTLILPQRFPLEGAPMRFVIVAMFGLAAIQGDPDQKAMQGRWTVTAYDQNGQAIPEAILRKMNVVIKGDKMTITPRVTAQYKPGFKEGKSQVQVDFSTEAGPADEATYRLNVEKGWMDLVWQGPQGQSKTTKGIYVVDGNSLKICFAMADKSRPKKMPEQPKTGTVRLELKRAEK